MNHETPVPEPSSRGTVVVCGATGYLGHHVVRALHGDGWRVRALVRDAARQGDAADACDEVFVGRPTDPETLDGLFDGADRRSRPSGPVRSSVAPAFVTSTNERT
ncbi:MAG: NmrA family NAD(P)-binding protein [Ilumatobacteraceae bacterium]